MLFRSGQLTCTVYNIGQSSAIFQVFVIGQAIFGHTKLIPLQLKVTLCSLASMQCVHEFVQTTTCCSIDSHVACSNLMQANIYKVVFEQYHTIYQKSLNLAI